MGVLTVSTVVSFGGGAISSSIYHTLEGKGGDQCFICYTPAVRCPQLAGTGIRRGEVIIFPLIDKNIPTPSTVVCFKNNDV